MEQSATNKHNGNTSTQILKTQTQFNSINITLPNNKKKKV